MDQVWQADLKSEWVGSEVIMIFINRDEDNTK